MSWYLHVINSNLGVCDIQPSILYLNVSADSQVSVICIRTLKAEMSQDNQRKIGV